MPRASTSVRRAPTQISSRWKSELVLDIGDDLRGAQRDDPADVA
jgi:hypothetical protein